MGPVVVIPDDYEELSIAQRENIIPICMAAFDRQGRAIAPDWFFRGVAPIRRELVVIARFVLGDPWCVSELAEVTVHRLWARHGSSVGRYPARRVLKKAMWLADELRTGDWRKVKHPNLYTAIDALDERIRDQTLVDPRQYAAKFEEQIMLDEFEDRLGREGRREIRAVYRLIRLGYSWQEVGEVVGAARLEIVRRRFYRWIKKARE